MQKLLLHGHFPHSFHFAAFQREPGETCREESGRPIYCIILIKIKSHFFQIKKKGGDELTSEFTIYVIHNTNISG